MKQGGTQNICMQTHLTYLLNPEKVLPVVLFVLGNFVRQTKRQHFPVLYVLPIKKGLRHLDQ